MLKVPTNSLPAHFTASAGSLGLMGFTRILLHYKKIPQLIPVFNHYPFLKVVSYISIQFSQVIFLMSCPIKS